ncbi:class I SAM-dependent methyltransferase [bacterium]|nr:class I SAM-dependent methyltransferase [bacterium]MBU1675382.1 class I SAM-dependent methyltransferase [bacterium]
MLDFGCGNGAQTILFADHARKIYGLDVSESYLNDFRKHARELGLENSLEAVHYDGRNIPVSDGSIDCLTTFEVLEHVPDEMHALSEIYRVLAPGGLLFITVPNRWWIFETHGADLPLLPWNRVPFFSWLPKRIHDRYARARIYGRDEIVRELVEAGFLIRDVMYITAPMDVVKWRRLRDFLRKTVFRGDTTRVPILATAILAVAMKPE